MKSFKAFCEEFVFRVEVEGLPSMFMKGNSPGEVKTHLRKLVKQPSMVKSVDRMTKHDVKKRRRKQAVIGEAMATAGDHEDAAHAHRTASKTSRLDLKAVKAHEKAAEHHDTAAKHLRSGNAYAAQNAHINAKNEADKAKDYGNVHSKRAHADTRAIGEARSADVKPEKYIGPDGKTKIRMVPVTREAMNRRDKLRSKLATVGKDMEKTNQDIKKASGIKDKPKVRLGSDGKPYKSRYEEVDPARDEGKPGAAKHAREMTPGQKTEKITIGKIRKMAYKTGKTLGDVQAVKKKRVGKRIARRAVGKLASRAIGALLK